MEEYKLIERSIIKKYRKEIWSKFIHAIIDYELINQSKAMIPKEFVKVLEEGYKRIMEPPGNSQKFDYWSQNEEERKKTLLPLHHPPPQPRQHPDAVAGLLYK